MSFSQANVSQGLFNIRFCKDIIYLKQLAGQVPFLFYFIWKHEDTNIKCWHWGTRDGIGTIVRHICRGCQNIN